MTPLTPIRESAFASRVLAARLPVVVLFASAGCAVCRALAPLVAHVAASYTNKLLFGKLNAGGTSLVAEQFGIAAVPTLGVFEHGELLTRLVGFVPEGLLRAFLDEAHQGSSMPNSFWSPSEALLEDTVIIPLVQAWGFRYERQVACSILSGSTSGRGRIDVLLYPPDQANPLTLIETKRRIASADQLAAAAAQAQRYACALGLASFLVAAPSGLWVYASVAAGARCVARFTSLEVYQQPARVAGLLKQLHSA